MRNNWTKAIQVLKTGGVIVSPTDTIYGILADALSKSAVVRVYKVKGRDDGKPLIVLIHSFEDLKKFGVKLTLDQDKFLCKVWPGKVSVILPVLSEKFKYIHRSTKTIAFRMVGPRNPNLYHLIHAVGPLVAPSANPQGETPATTVWEAEKYFGDSIDMYLCGHTRISKPSTLVRYTGKKLEMLRQGAVKIK